MEWLLRPFDTSGFPPRWHCGLWSASLGWTHIISDLLIFAAYFTIPIALAVLVVRRRDAPRPDLLILFALFILCCGGTHLVEAIIFYEPVYRFAAALKAATAAVSLLTAFVLVRSMPAILAAPAVLRERQSLRETLAIERQRSDELAVEREPLAKRSAELTARSRRVSEALAAGRVVAARWDVATGVFGWEIGMVENSPLIGLARGMAIKDWSGLVSAEDATQLRAIAAQAETSGRPFEFECALAGTAGWKIRLTATIDPEVKGEPRTATGMFRFIEANETAHGHP